MFNEVTSVHAHRIKSNAELLKDIGLLAEAFDPKFKTNFDSLIAGIDCKERDLYEAFYSDHRVYQWLRRIRMEFLGIFERKSTTDIKPLVSEMLLQFEFALAVMEKREFSFTIPAGNAIKFIIPVTGSIVTFNPTSVPLQFKYFPAEGTFVSPTGHGSIKRYTTTDHIKIVDSHTDLFADPTGGQYPVELDESIDLEAWIAALKPALNFIKHDAGAAELVDKFVDYLVPLKQGGDVRNLSFSARSLPGVIFKNNECQPLLVAETLVHEADHQFFYALDQIDTMWSSDVRQQKAEHFSPWRDDPRPLDGILRGLSSFTRVSWFYALLLKNGGLNEVDKRAATIMLARRASESEAALDSVLNSAELSDFGKSFAQQILEVLHNVSNLGANFGDYIECKALAADEVKNRKKAWESNRSTSKENRFGGYGIECDDKPTALSKGPQKHPEERLSSTDKSTLFPSIYYSQTSNAKFFGDLCEIDPSVPPLLDSVAEILEKHNPRLVSNWRRSGILDKFYIYAVYYLLPLNTILPAAKKNDPKILAAYMLGFMAWREYDNLADNHVDQISGHGRALTASLELLNFVTKHFPVSLSESIASLEQHYSFMANQVRHERLEPIPVEKIWTRCSISFFVPELLKLIDEKRMDLLRNYINYSGLAHDLTDIGKDREAGIISLPVKWSSGLSQAGSVNLSNIRQLSEMALKEIRPIEEFFKSWRLDVEYPLFHRILQEVRLHFNAL